jgi:uncharacterized protein (DUF342 family)
MSKILQNSGEERERIAVRITDDGLKATMTLYISDSEHSADNHASLVREIIGALKNAGVIFGINAGILSGHMESGFEYLIAEGLPAVNGKDAEIRLYEVAAPKPKVIDQGKVDHYELNLINRVKQGDWLGERSDPTPGIPGKSVRGADILPAPGKNYPLEYDRSSVCEEYQNGITILRAKKTGAVYYRGSAVGVYDCLEIKGNIDFSTGNIDFNGYLSIKGTVDDNFSVTADKDIEILGDYGVGAADKICSREGNIYIKGGIAGKGKATVTCKKNLYVKYLSDINIICEGSVFVGFYCMNSNIRARQVIVESSKGRISGGQIDADICVSAADIGSRSETRTIVKVRGFDRNELLSDLEKITSMMKQKKDDLNRMTRKINAQSFSRSPEQNNIQENLKYECAKLRDAIKELELQYKSISEYLKTPGEGAVIAKSRLYPRVKIEIKDLFEEIPVETPMATYVIKDDKLIML